MGRSAFFFAASLALSLAPCAPCFGQDVAPAGEEQPTLRTLSQEIHSQLDDLRRQSRRLTEQLLTAESELRESSRRAEELKAELSALNSSLASTSERLENSLRRLSEYEERLRTRAAIIRAGLALLALAAAVRLVLAFLKAKAGIEIPYWLNVIL